MEENFNPSKRSEEIREQENSYRRRIIETMRKSLKDAYGGLIGSVVAWGIFPPLVYNLSTDSSWGEYAFTLDIGLAAVVLPIYSFLTFRQVNKLEELLRR